MNAVARCGLWLGLGFVLLASSSSVSAVDVELGQPAPDFLLPSVHADRIPVALSNYRGRVVYLDFWSAWCVPCRETMPALDALRRDLPRDDFEVIAVNVDTVVADARRYLEQVPVSYPVALDANGATARRYGVTTLPASVLIDREGTVRRAVRAAATEDVRALRTAVSSLIEGDDIQQ
jgi:thiol-disulfide isomerase/thioredoxin